MKPKHSKKEATRLAAKGPNTKAISPKQTKGPSKPKGPRENKTWSKATQKPAQNAIAGMNQKLQPQRNIQPKAKPLHNAAPQAAAVHAIHGPTKSQVTQHEINKNRHRAQTSKTETVTAQNQNKSEQNNKQNAKEKPNKN